MAQLTLGDATLITSPERDALVELRRRYMEVGCRHRAAFLANYTHFKNADELIQSLPGEVEQTFSETVTMIADDIAAHRIYDVDLATIRTELAKRLEAVRDGFDRVENQYFEILGKAAELDALRSEERENRGRIMGGGFGVEGAVGGMAIAAAANAAIGLTYGLANLTAKAASMMGDSKKKRALLKDPATSSDLGEFLYRITMQGSELVAAKVNGSSSQDTFELVSESARQRAVALAENVSSGRVPETDVVPVLIQSLGLDPFGEKTWHIWIDRFGDKDGSVGKSAAMLGLATDSYKVALLEKQRQALKWTTPEDCNESSIQLERWADWLGLPFEDERDRIEKLADELDRNRRTFNGVEYASLAEVAAARQAHDDALVAVQAAHEDEVRRTVAGVIHETHDAADMARTQIRDQAMANSHASNFLGWMVLAYRRNRDTAGRSCRKEFFMFIVCVLSVLLACIITLAVAVPPDPEKSDLPVAGVAATVFGLLFLAASIIVALALQIRRFHDQNRSGWFVLLNLIPYVGWLVALAFMLVEGTPGDNRYGPDPIDRES